MPGGGDHTFYTALDLNGAWNMPAVTWSAANGKLTSIVVGSGTATVNTAAAHNVQVGSVVVVSGASSGNGDYIVTYVPSSTSFQLKNWGLPNNATLQTAAAVLTNMPVLLVYLLAQRQLIRGVTLTGAKL